MIFIFILILALLLVYCIIPDLWFRYTSPKILRRGNSSGKYVYFTFDDGPHPVYTLQIINILKKYGIRAIFFVLGEKAEKFPQIIRAIKDSGNFIGNHGYSHKPVWILPPGSAVEEFEKTDRVIFDLIGERASYIRPPWGGANLGLVRFLNKEDRQVVLWTLDSKDWQREVSEEAVIKRVVEGVKPGDIILFHDGRWDDISERTVKVLPRIIEGLRDRGYEITGDLSREMCERSGILRRLVKTSWELWDRLFYIVTDTIKLDDPYMVLSFSINRYKWKPIYLKDGTVIKRGDRFLEIHFLNNIISNIPKTHKSPMGAGKEIKDRLIYSFDRILKYIEENDLNDVKAFHGVTVLYRMVGLDNIDTFDLNVFIRFFVNLYEKLILVIYHPEGFKRLRHRRKLSPKSIWISRNAMRSIVKRYRR